MQLNLILLWEDGVGDKDQNHHIIAMIAEKFGSKSSKFGHQGAKNTIYGFPELYISSQTRWTPCNSFVPQDGMNAWAFSPYLFVNINV